MRVRIITIALFGQAGNWTFAVDEVQEKELRALVELIAGSVAEEDETWKTGGQAAALPRLVKVKSVGDEELFFNPRHLIAIDLGRWSETEEKKA